MRKRNFLADVKLKQKVCFFFDGNIILLKSNAGAACIKVLNSAMATPQKPKGFRMKILLTVLIIGFAALSYPIAQEETLASPGDNEFVAETNLRTKNESWYTYWGLGWTGITYPKNLQELMNTIENIPGVSRTCVEFDFLGFYFPVNQHRTAIGFIINGAGDRVSEGGIWVQINQYIYGASVMHFVSRNIGDGFFLRGDLGLARMVVQTTFGNASSSDAGFGFLAGAGYAIPFTGTRILLNFNFSYHNIESETVSKVAISGGLLF